MMAASAPASSQVSELLAAIPGFRRAGCQLALDSRQIGPGDVFVGLPGLEHDGRAFVDEAFANGAVGALVESEGCNAEDDRIVPVPHLRAALPGLVKDFYGNPSDRMKLAAVTGTNGKTSVVELTGQLLRLLGSEAGCIGTLGSRLSHRPAAAVNTTPDLISMSRQLADWLDQGVEYAALEASSHALHQGRLAGLSLHTGVFTNLTRDHLDYHETEAAYARAKLALFETFDLERAVFNADDPVASQVAGISRDAAVGVSLAGGDCDVRVEVRSQGPMVLHIASPWGSAEIEVALTGRFNAFNVVAAIVTAVGFGFRFDDVCAAAAKLRPVAGRMERLIAPGGGLVVVDYAHTPDALENALKALRAETQAALWVVFGCGGDRDAGKSSMMGQVAGQWEDRVVVPSDNPRGESPRAIIEAIVLGTGSEVMVEVDRAAAIELALGRLAAGDTLLIAGKGHEDYQEVAGQRLAFSDRQVIEAFFAADGVAV